VGAALAVATVGCNSLLDIRELGGADAGASPGVDASADAAADVDIGADVFDAAAGDSTIAPDAGLSDASGDALRDAPDAPDAPSASDTGPDVSCSIVTSCAVGETACVTGGLAICMPQPGGCPVFGAPVACIDGESCVGTAAAYCCHDCCKTGGTCSAPSCLGGGAGQLYCGPAADDGCCATTEVPGGYFLRDYDGSQSFHDPSFPATVSTFALDRYEVTVARFRAFVQAWDGGWTPGAGSGKHAHLNGGKGLVDATGGTNAYETGWDSSWSGGIATTLTAWGTNLGCDTRNATWTPTTDTNEKAPINCVTWYEAYAFCIWDGGFLPSAAEWDYAAAGGGGSDGQRVYPWSIPPSAPHVDCEHANYGLCPPPGSWNSVGGDTSPLGDGKWGQADLAGNVWEWTLDLSRAYTTPCVDCAYLTDVSTQRVLRGGGFDDQAKNVFVSSKRAAAPGDRHGDQGIRCARVP
jgi:formylglycine-generating enzyme required for sulfatase activity